MNVVIDKTTKLALRWGYSDFPVTPTTEIIVTKQILDPKYDWEWDGKKFVQVADTKKAPRELVLQDVVTKKVKKVTIENGQFVIIDYPE